MLYTGREIAVESRVLRCVFELICEGYECIGRIVADSDDAIDALMNIKEAKKDLPVRIDMHCSNGYIVGGAFEIYGIISHEAGHYSRLEMLVRRKDGIELKVGEDKKWRK